MAKTKNTVNETNEAKAKNKLKPHTCQLLLLRMVHYGISNKNNNNDSNDNKNDNNNNNNNNNNNDNNNTGNSDEATSKQGTYN